MLLEWIWLTGSGFLFICCADLSQHVVKIIIEKKKKNVWGKSTWNAQQVGAEHSSRFLQLMILVPSRNKCEKYHQIPSISESQQHMSTYNLATMEELLWKSILEEHIYLLHFFTCMRNEPNIHWEFWFWPPHPDKTLFLYSCFVYADSTDTLNEKGELRVSFIESGFITSSQIWYFCFYSSHSCF